MIKRSEVFHHAPCVKARLESPIAKMQLKNIPKLFRAIGYSVKIQTVTEDGKTIHMIYVYRGGLANPSSCRTIYIEEICQ